MDLREVEQQAATRRKKLKRMRGELGKHSLSWDELREKLHLRRNQIAFLQMEIDTLQTEWYEADRITAQHGPRIVMMDAELSLLDEIIEAETAMHKKKRKRNEYIENRL